MALPAFVIPALSFLGGALIGSGSGGGEYTPEQRRLFRAQGDIAELIRRIMEQRQALVGPHAGEKFPGMSPVMEGLLMALNTSREAYKQPSLTLSTKNLYDPYASLRASPGGGSELPPPPSPAQGEDLPAPPPGELPILPTPPPPGERQRTPLSGSLFDPFRDYTKQLGGVLADLLTSNLKRKLLYNRSGSPPGPAELFPLPPEGEAGEVRIPIPGGTVLPRYPALPPWWRPNM